MKLRSSLTLSKKRIVIKLSSLAVTKPEGGVDPTLLRKISKDIAILKEKRFDIILVSSGAINAARPIKPGLNQKNNVASLQALSSIGQPMLMARFQKEFEKFNLTSAQILLTHEDLKSKKRSHNIRESLETLLKENVIPIINENDSVSFEEISLGDNDQLSAMITELTGSDLLLMLTKADGLYDRDPEEPNANFFKQVSFDQKFKEIKLATKTLTGKGGMETKLQAVRKLTPLGIEVIISSFSISSPIITPLTKEKGTLFIGDKVSSKKYKRNWILNRSRTGIGVIIDKGAMEALSKNASLLPAGILSIKGSFNRGDCIQVFYKNEIMAYGITEYSSSEVDKIKKLKSSEIGNALKFVPSKVVIHKNNLVKNTH